MPRRSDDIEHFTTPPPVWPEAPRYCSIIPFPSYAYVPGQSPHPRTLETDHFPLDTDAIAESDPRQAFCYGIDLYHFGYLWESHEAWEALWKQHKSSNPSLADFLQCLILNSAALLKMKAGNRNGAKSLFLKSQTRLARSIENDYAKNAYPFTCLNVFQLVCALDRCLADIEDGKNTVVAARLCVEQLPD